MFRQQNNVTKQQHTKSHTVFGEILNFSATLLF